MNILPYALPVNLYIANPIRKTTANAAETHGASMALISTNIAARKMRVASDLVFISLSPYRFSLIQQYCRFTN